MKRIFIMALAGAGSLAWVMLWGSAPALAESYSKLLQDAGAQEFPVGFDIPVGAEGLENAGEQDASDGGYTSSSPGLVSSKLALGGSWPDGHARLAPASLPSTGSMDSRSRLIEPQWFSGRLSLHETESAGTGEGILPAQPILPEPAALLLLGSGLLLLAAFGKKWKGKSTG